MTFGQKTASTGKTMQDKGVMAAHVKRQSNEELDVRQIIGDGPALWEQLAHENKQQYEAFLTYCKLPNRSIDRATVEHAKLGGKAYNRDYVKRLSMMYCWFRRAQAYDVYAERQRLLEAQDKEALAGRGAPNWQLRSKKARDDAYELSQKIKTVAKSALEQATKVESDESGSLNLGMKPGDWVSLARFGFALEKAALDWTTTGITGVARSKAAQKKAALEDDEIPLEQLATMSEAEMKQTLGRLSGKSGTTTKQ